MSSAYNMVLGPEFFEYIRVGALDHWQGETVPVRAPDRRIIGEAKIVSVDHREDGQVWVIVESELDSETLAPGLRGIAELVRGGEMSTMSFGFHDPEPHRPRRDDDVARWLKAKRDEGVTGDDLLDEYRARADYGLTLDADLSELPEGY